MATDVEAVVYLMLQNAMLHDLFPSVVTIGEDVSGMPTFCRCSTPFISPSAHSRVLPLDSSPGHSRARCPEQASDDSSCSIESCCMKGLLISARGFCALIQACVV